MTRPHVAMEPATTLADLGWSEAHAAYLRRELRSALEALSPTSRALVVYRLTSDGVETWPRDEIVARWKRHGLRELVLRLRAVPRGHVGLVCEGETDTTVLALDAARWLASGEGR